jgi:hypothetical protein
VKTLADQLAGKLLLPGGSLLPGNRPNFPHLTGSAENLFEIDNVK